MAKAKTHDRGNYEFRGAVEEYDERFLYCRDIGHHWIPNPHWEVTRNGSRVTEYHREVLCQNCDCRRRDTYDKNMGLIARYYKHNPGYIIGKEAQLRLTAADARMEMIRRAGLAPRRSGRTRRLRAV